MADASPEVLRISVDTKAVINIGEYSRGGRSRGIKAVRACNHDMMPKKRLIPGGILDPVTGKSFLFFGTNYKTSDFLVDGLLLWWKARKSQLSRVIQLVINLVMAYHMIRNGVPYKELGKDYLLHRRADKIVKNHLKRLRDLGYEVELQKVA